MLASNVLRLAATVAELVLTQTLTIEFAELASAALPFAALLTILELELAVVEMAATELLLSGHYYKYYHYEHHMAWCP